MSRSIRSLALVVAVFLPALTLSCEGDLGPNISGVPAYSIASVRVLPALDTVFVPDTIRLTDRAFFRAQAIGHTQKPLTITAFVWESSDPSVATVDDNGLVTPVGLGTTEISASAGKIGRARLVVAPAIALVQLTPASDTILTGVSIVPASDTVRLVASATTTNGTPLTGVAFTWESLTPAIATVDQTGLVHAVAFGAATIRVRAPGSQAIAIVVVREE